MFDMSVKDYVVLICKKKLLMRFVPYESSLTSRKLSVQEFPIFTNRNCITVHFVCPCTLYFCVKIAQKAWARNMFFAMKLWDLNLIYSNIRFIPGNRTERSTQTKMNAFLFTKKSEANLCIANRYQLYVHSAILSPIHISISTLIFEESVVRTCLKS